MVIGDSSEIERSDKGKIDDITTRVKDLTNRLNDIRREQVFQRVGLQPDLQNRGSKLTSYRNVRPNSEINPNLPTDV